MSAIASIEFVQKHGKRCFDCGNGDCLAITRKVVLLHNISARARQGCVNQSDRFTLGRTSRARDPGCGNADVGSERAPRAVRHSFGAFRTDCAAVLEDFTGHAEKAGLGAVDICNDAAEEKG